MLQSVVMLAALQLSAGEPGFDQIPRAIQQRGMKNVIVCPSAIVKVQSKGGGDGQFLDGLAGGIISGVVNQVLGGQAGGLPLGGGGFPGGGGLPLGGGGFPGGGLPLGGGGLPLGGGGLPLGGGGLPLGGGGFPGGSGGFPIGANANSMPQQLAGQLLGQGLTQILGRDQSRNAMGGMRASDVTNAGAQSLLRQRTNADGLVVMEVAPDASKFNQTVRVYDLRQSQQDAQRNPGAQARPVEEFVSNEAMSLGTLAYGGASFELWRPDENSQTLELTKVGLSDLPPGTQVASNRASEVKLANYVTYWKDDKNRHPLADPSFPYRMEVMVGDEIRPLIDYDGQILVRLEHGEKFQIRFTNQLSVPVRCGIWIDGVNMINDGMNDTTPWNPGLVPDVQRLNTRIWFMEPRKTFGFKGWTASAVNSQRDFVVNRPERSLAYTLGNAEKLGMFTAVIYQAGTTFASVRSKGGEIGIGEGEIREFKGRLVQSTVGPMLAAVTINYRTQKEIDALQKTPIKRDTLESDDETTPFPVASKAQVPPPPPPSDAVSSGESN